MAKLRR